MKDDIFILWERGSSGPTASIIANRGGDETPMLSDREEKRKLFSPLKVAKDHRLFGLDKLAKLYPLPAQPSEPSGG